MQNLRLMPALATKAQFLQGDGNKEPPEMLFATAFNFDPSSVQWWSPFVSTFCGEDRHNLEVVPPHNSSKCRRFAPTISSERSLHALPHLSQFFLHFKFQDLNKNTLLL